MVERPIGLSLRGPFSKTHEAEAQKGSSPEGLQPTLPYHAIRKPCPRPALVFPPASPPPNWLLMFCPAGKLRNGEGKQILIQNLTKTIPRHCCVSSKQRLVSFHSVFSYPFMGSVGCLIKKKQPRLKIKCLHKQEEVFKEGKKTGGLLSAPRVHGLYSMPTLLSIDPFK